MAAINFPGSPSLNDTHSENGRMWIWNGTSWVSMTNTGYTGSSGNALKSIYISSPSASETLVLFYTTNNITLSKVRAVLTGTTPDVTYSIKSGSNITSTDETHVSSANVTSTTTGTDATIADASITAGRWVWLELTVNSGTVTTVVITLEF